MKKIDVKLVIDGGSFQFYEADDKTLKEFMEWMKKKGTPNTGSCKPKKHMLFAIRNFKMLQTGDQAW